MTDTCLILVFLVSLYINAMPKLLPLITIPPLEKSRWLFWLVTFSVVGMALALLGVKSGVSQINFNPSKIYEYRHGQKESIAGLSAYLVNWSSKIVIPLVLLLGIAQRKMWLVSLAFAMSVLFFGFVNSKANILFPLLVTFIFLGVILLKSSTKFMLGVVIAILVIVVVGEIFNVNALVGLLIRRALFSGAMNLSYYMEFFDGYHLYWSNSFLSSLSDYPFEMPPGEVIGNWLGEPNNHNAGFVASGFMQAGYAGVFVYSTGIVVVLMLLDWIASIGVENERDNALITSIALPQFLHVSINVDFVNALVTHGVVFMLFIVYLTRSKKLEKNDR